MNKTFKMIWSKVKAAWVIVSEIVSSNGGATAVTISHTKPKAGRWIISAALQATLVAGLLTLFAPFAAALPTNPQVIHGTANIQTSGTMMNITNSPNAIINWGSFSIAANETARFIQQSANSNVLNRVTGGDPSRIFGALQSNGRVFLINQNGILIGANARIDVAGLVASTLNLSNQDFLAGKMQFGDGTPGGKLENQGMITTPEGGQVYLIAPDVTNKGTITAPNGDLLLAAGKEVLLVEKTTPEIAYVVSAPEDQAINLGTIAADVGRVGMYGSVVRNSGKISADSATSTGGKIYLRATKKIELAETSSISANGVKGGEIIAMTAQNGVVTGELTARGSITAKGDGSKNSGGFVETSAGKLDLHGVQINTNGGTWLIDPVDFVIGDDNGSGDIAASAVGTALETNDVTIQTTSEQPSCTGLNCQITGGGGTGDSGDITVNDAISWSSGTKLTLESWNDIKINAAITGENGNLKLEAGKDNQTAEVGKITQTENGVITVGTLDVTAKTGITLDKAANEVSKFKAANETYGGISFTNTIPLKITGAVYTAAASEASIAINNKGNITIASEINAGIDAGSAAEHKVQITSTEGSITQESNGKIIANWLDVEAANGIELDKDGNEVRYFTASNTENGNIKFTNSRSSANELLMLGSPVDAGVITNQAGDITITSTNAGIRIQSDTTISTVDSGDITITGTSEEGTGVDVNGGTITTNGGNIYITGTSTTGGFAGVDLVLDSAITSNGGNITITGKGGSNSNADVSINGMISSDTGNINIKGMSTVSDYNVRIEPYGSVGLVQRETPQEGYINFTGNL
ncbi:MAG: filamentous hemagglutinin N-terminal domain-containing protein, partial [Trichlorobacter sp.]|nr:filamentous hemagglutinin N-terminal domain-containing protein [Trichlorobacter sp.]